MKHKMVYGCVYIYPYRPRIDWGNPENKRDPEWEMLLAKCYEMLLNTPCETAGQIIRTVRRYNEVRSAVLKGNKKNLLRALNNLVYPDFESGMTCIQLAVSLGHHDLIRPLILHGYTPKNAIRYLGESPKPLECLNELEDYKKRINLEEQYEMKRTILFSTAVEQPERIEVIKKLLEMGSSVHTIDYRMKGILHRLCRKDFTTKPYLKVAELLVERGINLEQSMGITALHSAVKNNNPHFTDFLLGKGARFCPTLYFELKLKTHSCIEPVLKLGMVRKVQGKKVNEKLADFVKSKKWTREHYAASKTIRLSKKQKITNTNWSVHDFLRKPTRIIAKHVRNKNFLAGIEEAMERSELKYYIEATLKDAFIRRDLEDSCAEIFQLFFELPELCSEILISYLSEDDLRNIITAWKMESLHRIRAYFESNAHKAGNRLNPLYLYALKSNRKKIIMM